MSVAALSAVMAAWTAGPPAQVDDRTFVDIDPARVRASIEKVEAVTSRSPGCVVVVEVTRPKGFEGYVEPLRFRLTPRGKGAEPIFVQRVEAPFHGRAGRAAGPRSETFPLLVSLEAKTAKGARVEVVDVSAWTGAAPRAEEPVAVGKPATAAEFDSVQQRSLARTTIPLRNLTGHDVTVVLSADFIRPRKGTSLVHGVVPAGGTLDLVVGALSIGRGEFPGAEIRRVRLVDWSILADDGAEEARRLFAGAWDGAYRVPRDEFPLGARFTWEFRSAELDSARSGVLRLDADGEVSLRLHGEHDAKGANTVKADLERALWCIARPEAAEVLASGVTLVRRGPRTVVRVGANPLRAGYDGALSFVLESGRIVGSSLDVMAAELGTGNPSVWTWTKDDPLLLAGRRDTMFRGNPEAYVALEIDWSDAGGTWLPARATTREGEWSPGMGDTTTVSFGGWTRDAPGLAEAAVPAIRVADGRVAGLRTSFGAEVAFRWETVKGALVPVERTSGDEVVSVQWEKVSGDWLFPARVDFVRVFGRDWGPESLELSNVEIDSER